MASTNSQRKEFAREDYSPVNVDKWDGGAVKNNLDDTVKIIMKKHYEYTEDFHLVNQRLIICTIACLFSLFSVVYDYYHPFPQSKYILATCSI
jgi:signal peptidase complex subunit 2